MVVACHSALGKKRLSWARCASRGLQGAPSPTRIHSLVKRGSRACFRSFKDCPGLMAPRAQPAPPAGLRDTILGPTMLRSYACLLPFTLSFLAMQQRSPHPPPLVTPASSLASEPRQRWGDSNNGRLKGPPFSPQGVWRAQESFLLAGYLQPLRLWNPDVHHP